MATTFGRSLLLFALLITCLDIRAEEAVSKHALFINLFIHDDVPQSRINKLRQDYFIWLIKDLESITGRRVQLKFIRDVPTLTNFPYKAQSMEQGLLLWVNRLGNYLDVHNLPLNRTSKYLLLTRDKLDDSGLGVALDQGHTGIASLEAYTAPAHELGHMFGATHDASQVLYRKGWWCETNLAPKRNRTLANCYVFSDANRQLISNYLRRYP